MPSQYDKINPLSKLNPTCDPRRQRLTERLHPHGPRVMLELLAAVESGRDLEEVLEDFCRLDAGLLHALGGDVQVVWSPMLVPAIDEGDA
jgi:hypothetical protein